jgi:hypothetical protein
MSFCEGRVFIMGVLTNGKHEVFAQEIARGTAITKAYVLAGYPANRGNASRLRLHEGIKARIAELQGQKTAAVELAQLTAAEKAGVDAFWVMRGLRRNATLAARRGDTAASNRAMELIGKHLGMFIDKKAIEISYIDDSDEYLARILAIVEGKADVVDAEPLQLQNDGQTYGSNGTADAEAVDIADESS